LGVSAQSLRKWASKAAIDRQERDDGLTTAEREELRELSKRVKRLTQERDIVKHATPSLRGKTETR
jgi:transposase-like protein